MLAVLVLSGLDASDVGIGEAGREDVDPVAALPFEDEELTFGPVEGASCVILVDLEMDFFWAGEHDQLLWRAFVQFDIPCGGCLALLECYEHVVCVFDAGGEDEAGMRETMLVMEYCAENARRCQKDERCDGERELHGVTLLCGWLRNTEILRFAQDDGA